MEKTITFEEIEEIIFRIFGARSYSTWRSFVLTDISPQQLELRNDEMKSRRRTLDDDIERTVSSNFNKKERKREREREREREDRKLREDDVANLGDERGLKYFSISQGESAKAVLSL